MRFKIVGKIVSITNQKGGVGKTTTAVSLAFALAEEGKKTLFVDIDPQANGTSSYGINKQQLKKSVYEVLVEGCDVQEAIVITKYKNIDILPANMNLAGAEIEMVAMENREGLLKAALNKIRHRYEYIIIDLPPIGEVSDAISVSNLLDGIVLVVRENYCSRPALSAALHQFEFVGTKILGIVMNDASDTNKGYGKGYYKKYRKYGYYYRNKNKD